MAKTTELTHQLCTLIYFVILFVIIAYCLLNAMYTVIIGGYDILSLCQFSTGSTAYFALRTSLDSCIYANLGLVLLIVGLLYTHRLDFLSHLKAIVLIPALMLTLFSLHSIYKHPTRLMLLKIGLMLALLLAYSQYYELVELQNYYNSLHNGETWQQFGAL